MGYSLDLRRRVVDYINQGHSREEAAKVFQVGVRTVYRWLARAKSNQLAETKAAKPWKKLDPVKLTSAVSEHSNWLLSDFAKLFNVTTAAICLAFRTLGITRKKSLPFTESGMKQSGNYFWQISPNTKPKT